jgi:hypothetical protein
MNKAGSAAAAAGGRGKSGSRIRLEEVVGAKEGQRSKDPKILSRLCERRKEGKEFGAMCKKITTKHLIASSK